MERISADWLKKTTWLVPFLWIMLAFLAFRETLNVFFVQDDFWFLEAVNQPLPNRMMLTGVLPDYLRPLPTFWFMLANRGLWGLNSIGFHLVLIGFFSATLYLVYSLTRSLTGSCLAASAGAVVYGLSSLHLYNLGWISGAIDVLAAFFLSLTLWAAFRYARNQSALWLVAVGYAAALLSKETSLVVGVALAAWFLLRAAIERRKPSRSDWYLLGTLLGISLVYLLAWSWWVSSNDALGGMLGFSPDRFIYVLQSSLVGLLPFSLDPNQMPVIWLLLPIAGLALLAYSKPAARLADVFLTGLLWLLPAGLFLFTQRPAVMYPYYAHFSLIGLALMVSLWVAALVEWIGRYRSQPILLIGLTVLLIVYAAISALNAFQGVRTAQSPALKQARYSEAAYDQITEFLDPGAYQEIIFLDTSEVMWWSMGKGVMIPVMFPGLTAHFDCYDGYLAQPGITTTPAILVLRMVSESEFKLVR